MDNFMVRATVMTVDNDKGVATLRITEGPMKDMGIEVHWDPNDDEEGGYSVDDELELEMAKN